MAIQLTSEDIQDLKTFKDNEDYSGAYEFLRIQLIASGQNGDPNTATWLGIAAIINADDGSADGMVSIQQDTYDENTGEVSSQTITDVKLDYDFSNLNATDQVLWEQRLGILERFNGQPFFDASSASSGDVVGTTTLPDGSTLVLNMQYLKKGRLYAQHPFHNGSWSKSKAHMLTWKLMFTKVC